MFVESVSCIALYHFVMYVVQALDGVEVGFVRNIGACLAYLLK